MVVGGIVHHALGLEVRVLRGGVAWRLRVVDAHQSAAESVQRTARFGTRERMSGLHRGRLAAVALAWAATVGCRCDTLPVQLDPATVDFGDVRAGERVERSVSLKNNGGGPLTLVALSLDHTFGRPELYEVITTTPLSVAVGHYCCANQGNGCCRQGGCGSDCCKCPRNGLNFCVNPAFGCGGC